MKYSVSLLERLATHPSTAADHNLMTIQYRMHPHIAKVVSSIFYEDKLTTASTVACQRKRANPIRFIDVQGQEEKQGFSFKNLSEVSTVVRVVQKELLENPGQLINVIAFHKPQMFALRKELEVS
jgi:superfamily I DNA and/or RNA helicase